MEKPKEVVRLLVDVLRSPVGPLRLVCEEKGRALVALDWDANEERVAKALARRGQEPEIVRTKNPFGISAALREYFDGNVAVLDTLPVASRGTPFQESVWQALRTIPVGTTTSYGALAVKIGRPKAIRAVGMANHWNPVGIVVPCHRVVGANGTLTGYAGGLNRKAWLLEHEARHSKTAEPFQFQLRGTA